MDKQLIKESIKKTINKTKGLILELESNTHPISPDCAVDHALRMEKLNEDTLQLNRLNKAKQKLINLKNVLNKVDHTQFGVCIKCQNTIPIQRILLIPESLTCVNCSD